MSRLLSRWEARYVRWLRWGLHLVAAGALALALVSGALFALGMASWLLTGKSTNLELPLLGGTLGVVAMAQIWAGAVMLLVTLRVLVALDRRNGGVAWMLDGDDCSGEEQAREEALRRWDDS